MRSPVVRCIVVLLSLALANGNAHFALHLAGAHSEPCPEGHAHHDGHTSPHDPHNSDKGSQCCCDCLGCSPVAQLPAGLNATPLEFTSNRYFDATTASLSSRTVPPEPDPPRPGAVS